MPGEQLFEIARRTFDTPEFRGIECIEVEAKSIINKVPAASQVPFDYTINPYRGCSHACTYCFARPTHTYLNMNAGRDFETKIVVKVNAPDVLRRELGAKRWRGDHIAMGTNTDPYQRVEGRYRLMRGILEALIDHRNPFSILTKGTLITRDVDLLVRAAEHSPVSAAFSIGTLDEDVWRDTEPGTPNPKARIEALHTLVDAGIPTGVLIAPILPGLSDRPDQLRAVVEAALDAGASSVSPIMLHLRRGVREEFMPWLREHHPDLVERYERAYRTPYGPKDARETLSRRVRSYAAGRTGKLERTVAGRFGHRAADRRSGAPLPPEPEQLSMWTGPSGQDRSATPSPSTGAGRPR
jgi:DNA repair photolyase